MTTQSKRIDVEVYNELLRMQRSCFVADVKPSTRSKNIHQRIAEPALASLSKRLGGNPNRVSPATAIDA